MTSVVCQAYPISLSLPLSSHSCASGFPGLRRREPLPPQSHRYRDASELASRPPLSGSNRIIPPPQSRYVDVRYSKSFVDTETPSAQPPHRHYPPSSKDHDVFSSRHPDTDMSRFDRLRNSGHDAGNVYVDKFSRDDHIKVDLLYPPRDLYEEPVHPQDSVNRSSPYNDPMNREPIPPTPHSREHVRRRSRDRSPRLHRELRQTGTQSSSALLPAATSGPPQAMQFVEDHRHRERRIDRDRGVGNVVSSVKANLFDRTLFRATIPHQREIHRTQWPQDPDLRGNTMYPMEVGIICTWFIACDPLNTDFLASRSNFPRML